MKQIFAVIQRDKLDLVIAAIENEQIGGVTVFPAQGRGKGERPKVGDPRGTGKHTAQFNALESVIVVVDDSKADAVANAIVNAASTGSKADGKVFITPVEQTIDIGSKSKGDSAL